MTEIKNVKTAFVEDAIIDSGLPMTIGEPMEREITEDDIKRARTLANAPGGSGHDNFLNGCKVKFWIKYPQYLSPQLQRYHWFDILSSQSKMHRLTAQQLSNDNCNKYALIGIIELINELIDNYNKDPSYENFMFVVSNLPAGYEMWMSVTTNYLQLKTIYRQRKNHKLKEDYKAIIDMIKALPYSEFITGGESLCILR
jgi:hypothetical protein